MAGIYITLQEYDVTPSGSTGIVSLPPGSLGLVDPSDVTQYVFQGTKIPRSIVLANPSYFAPFQDQAYWGPLADGSDAYFICEGSISQTSFDADDDSHLLAYALQDAWESEAGAVLELQRRYLHRRLRELADGLNNGWRPDWEDGTQVKYYPCFEHRVWKACHTYLCHVPGVVYFKSETALCQAVGLLGGLVDQLRQAWQQ